MNMRLLSTLVSILVLSTASGLADYTIPIPSGPSLIANHLDNGGNTLDEVLPGVGDGTQIDKWNCTGYTTYTKDAAGWTPAGGTLAPGEGAFIINNGAPFNLTFTGVPHVPVLPPPLPCGCGTNNLVSAQTTNSPSTFEDIMGFTPPASAQLLRFVGGGFSAYTFEDVDGAWQPSTPTLNIGEAAFIKVPACSTAPIIICATNKTVDGCSAWSFDPPASIVDNCYTNYALTSSTVTNSGPCPLVTTRTWVIKDICGNSNSCSQTVTVNCCTNSSTNCCDNCTQPYPASYTNIINPGVNFVANHLCQGANNTLDEVLGNVPDGTVFYTWDPATQSYGSSQTYYAGAGWYDDFGNSSTDVIAPGEGFVLQNGSGAPFSLVIRGCEPACPPPCVPPSGRSLVGRLGIGTASWTNLFSCPPPCGARMTVWNGSGFTDYDYVNNVWTPQEPVLAIGQSAFVSVLTNANCLPCTNNLVVNGGFEVTSPAVPPNTPMNNLSATTGVPGWTTTAGNTLEVWGNTVNGLPASQGVNHMEINAQSNDQTVSQVVSNLSPNCLATFCFDYTGRFGLSGATYNNDFTVTLSGGYSLSVPLDPAIYSVGGWTNFWVSFVPTSSTITISFRGKPHFANGVQTQGGAHIDNVSLTQCCPTNRCITLTCAGDKTVPCGSIWKFDAPMNIVDACCTNYNITFSTVTNSGPCPLVLTGTWLVSDTCGNSNTCSQTVTVVDTTPPTLTCSSHKTVLCGSAWSFDVPAATDNCSGTNVTFTFTTKTNGVCPQVITRTWTAADPCGNTNTCTQTVTVMSCVPPPAGMALWLPFDETSGTTSANLYPGGNSGIQINGPAVNTGYVANSLCFDGQTEYVEVPDYPAINIGTGDFSVDAWVKPAAFDNSLRIIVDHRAEAGSVIGYSLFLGGGNTIGFQIGDGTFVNYPSAFSVPADGQWHQVAVTVKRSDPQGIHFYLDGVVAGLGRDPTGHPGSITPPSNYPLRVGSRSSSVSGLFPGCIDEVEVFSRELATNEVQGLFNAGSAGKCKSSTLVCATNKVVQCGSNWSFDPPVVAAPCNGTNSALAILGTVTNGVCPAVVTRTWLVVDACGRTNTCSQTVTIVDTTPPVIICPTNMVVMACKNTGVVVHYAATATDNCCANVTLGSTPPSGSVFLPGSTTVSCTATDCCGNVFTCGFTVTVNVVNDTAPPLFTTYCVTNHIVIGGNNFASPVAASPSANLKTRLQSAGVTCFKNFDVCSVNCYLAHTFTNLPPCITAATLTIRLKPCGDICGNDSINLSFTGAGGTLLSNSWTRFLGSGNPQAGLLANYWCGYGSGQVVTLDLSALPQAVGPALNDLPSLNANGFLDFNCQDDSGVDYVILDVVSCCCATNKTIPYGTPWSFDQPSVFDAIWGTNVTITSSTTTNGLCPLVITRTWIATDPCGNTSTCSQTVTVGQAGPCQIFNTGMSGTNGNIPVASGSADPNFVLLSSPGAGTSCVVEGTLAGPWLPNSTASQWVGPASDTSASPIGVYHYQLTFILCCTNNAQMNGRLLVDDSAGLFLNGNPAGTAISYATFAPINITSGFVPGVNVLDIYVTNAIIFTGFRAELTNCASGLVVACPKSRVVDCGTKWDFDLPVASSCCSSNLTITVTSATTNGICPKTATKTWRITDGCGNTNFCSQSITIRDTTPPIIKCPTNRIIVALDKNCNLHIPLIQPSASDNCSPPSQLVYTQNPPVGSVLPGPCQPVTVTVRDACGNSASCQILVCGQDKTPPIVLFPKVITVTNCIVPNVLPFLNVSDNCTASNKLVFTQSPPAGTPMAAGGNIVTVTVTDLAGNTTTIVITLVNSGPSSFLNNLFNTGVDPSKVVLSGGAVDPHYTLGPVPVGTPTGVGNYNAPNAVVVTGLWGLPPFTLSRWIAPAVNTLSFPPGSYTYTNQFTLPSGANPLTASLSGRWAADNGARMYLNGLAPANQVALIPSPYGFSSWNSFTANSGFLAFPAVNKLYCVVTNRETYTGLRVEITNAVVNCSTCTPPSVVWSTPNQSRPVNSTAVFSATVWGTPPLTFQWYHNGLPLANGGHYSGVNTPNLTITPVGFADAGTYYVCVSNPCGGICSVPRKLNVTKGWFPWPWAWWNFAQIGNPMAATVGPDLILTGTNTLGISSGSTVDFDLPGVGGQIANVINVQPLPPDTFIQLPFVAPPDSVSVSSYTLIMDVYASSNSSGSSTLFKVAVGQGAGSGIVGSMTSDGAVSVTGTVGGVPVNVGPSLVLSPQPAWSRVALVVDQPDEDTLGEAALRLYVNGESAGSITFHGTPHVPVLPVDYLADIPATLLSSPEGTSGESYVSSIQFHAVAMTSEMIAGLGSPDSGPTPANDTSVGVQPVLSATTSNGIVHFTWTGSTFVLQESSDLATGVWVDSRLPFDETEADGDIVTTAHANPATEGAVKFYRLSYAP